MHVGVLEDDVDQQVLVRLWLVSAQYTCTMSAMVEGVKSRLFINPFNKKFWFSALPVFKRLHR